MRWGLLIWCRRGCWQGLGLNPVRKGSLAVCCLGYALCREDRSGLADWAGGVGWEGEPRWSVLPNSCALAVLCALGSLRPSALPVLSCRPLFARLTLPCSCSPAGNGSVWRMEICKEAIIRLPNAVVFPVGADYINRIAAMNQDGLCTFVGGDKTPNLVGNIIKQFRAIQPGVIADDFAECADQNGRPAGKNAKHLNPGRVTRLLTGAPFPCMLPVESISVTRIQCKGWAPKQARQGRGVGRHACLQQPAPEPAPCSPTCYTDTAHHLRH